MEIDTCENAGNETRANIKKTRRPAKRENEFMAHLMHGWCHPVRSYDFTSQRNKILMDYD
jgi:hypothetical protein